MEEHQDKHFNNDSFMIRDFEYKRGSITLVESKVVDKKIGKIIYTKDIKLIFPNNKIKLLGDYIPYDWRLVSFFDIFPNGKMPMDGEAHFKTYILTATGPKFIRYGDLLHDGALLILLHEIKHALRHNSEETQNDLIKGQIIINKYLTAPVHWELNKNEIQARGEDPNDYFELSVLPLRQSNDSPEISCADVKMVFIPRIIIEQYGRYWANNERLSWVFAIQELRALRKQGMDLEENMQNRDIANLIYSALEGHEFHFNTEMFRSNKPAQPFTKGKSFTRINLDWLRCSKKP